MAKQTEAAPDLSQHWVVTAHNHGEAVTLEARFRKARVKVVTGAGETSSYITVAHKDAHKVSEIAGKEAVGIRSREATPD